jgi:exosortase
MDASGILTSLLAACIVWSYWPTLLEMERTWATNPRYSHGYLVLPFAFYLLWCRRDLRPTQSSFRWFGLVFIAATVLIQCLGVVFYVSWLDGLAFLVSLTGLSVFAFGKEGLRWAWPSLTFLIFMVPLPYRAEVALGAPLQRISTEASTYGLQVFGLPAFSSGETIVIGGFRMGIVDACNGLGISYMFLACSVAAAFITWRPALDRAILIVSAIPIALFTNVSRIIATGVLHETLSERASGVVYHDLAGWIMLGITLLILFGECRFLKLVFVETSDSPAKLESPEYEPAIGTERTVPRDSRFALIAIAWAIPLVVLFGIAVGRWTDRWQVAPKLSLAVSRMEQMPTIMGDWRGRARPVDPRAMQHASVQGIVSRTFVHQRTGTSISIVLVFGRPGPVSVHTPDICYPGAGYAMLQTHPSKIAVELQSTKSSAVFLAADFENRRSLPADRLRIYWAWSADGSWDVPENPRIVYARRSNLYKLYVVSRTAADPDVSLDELTNDFVAQLLHELDAILFATETTSIGQQPTVSKLGSGPTPLCSDARYAMGCLAASRNGAVGVDALGEAPASLRFGSEVCSKQVTAEAVANRVCWRYDGYKRSNTVRRTFMPTPVDRYTRRIDSAHCAGTPAPRYAA